MDIVAYAKANPGKAAAVGVIAFAAVWLLLPSGSSSKTAASSGGVSDAELGASLQMAQLNAQLRATQAGYQSQLAIAQENNSAKLALARLEAQTQNSAQTSEYAYLSDRDRLTYELQTANSLANLEISKQTLGSQERINLAGINAQLQVSRDAQETARFFSNNALQQSLALADVQRQQIVTGGQVSMKQIQANVDVAGIQAANSAFGNVLGFVGGFL